MIKYYQMHLQTFSDEIYTTEDLVVVDPDEQIKAAIEREMVYLNFIVKKTYFFIWNFTRKKFINRMYLR